MTTALEIDNRAATEYSGCIRIKFLHLRELAKASAALMIEASNVTREIGDDLIGWCKHDQMSPGFYLAHQAEFPRELTFERVKRFIAAKHRFPDPIENLYDAHEVMQLTFRGLGMIEEPKRLTQQSSSGQTQLVILLNEFKAARGEYQKLIEAEPVDKWTEKQKELIRDELKWAVELYERIL
jgi:hypothetical protein